MMYRLAIGAICTLCVCAVTAIEDFNTSSEVVYVTRVNKNGDVEYISEDLMRRLDEEAVNWHWTPWIRTRTQVVEKYVTDVTCFSENSVDSFPPGIFDDAQLRQGGFMLYVLFGLYAFTLLAIVCNDYFIPCVELICEDLKIPQNVAAATFMSVATSCPEFFVNVISTFLTQSDMGIGTIVGSALFNILGVAAIGSLAARTPIKIDRRPVTRDALIYMINVSVLVVIVWDGEVIWYEALVLGLLYIVYFFVMFNSMKIFALYDKIVGCCCRRPEYVVNEVDKSTEDGIDNKAYSTDNISNGNTVTDKQIEEKVEGKPAKSLFKFPSKKSLIYRIWWLYSWPLRLVLSCTIPSPVTHRRLYPISFIMCIVWIGGNSYFVSWSMTVIGHTFLIPDSVMGMTFLAFGGCLPEALSIYIMSRRGEGGIGVSNALGANSLAILFALGMPWMIQTLTFLVQGSETTSVYINSAGIDFVVASLLIAVVVLWAVLYIGKFHMRRSVGIVLICLYFAFITFAILLEMEIILPSASIC
ncbi:sodium/potassium/calcium exchanger 4 [Pieris rapae]|uniref:sodium/potassium/calcium exchanger 4 n=1 Tax=Pieris rapae TaxID=64459 RepID=UPI000B92DC20|nr:sodium/potassium/calcium exchanger 4 [Pieris rapae]XP_022121469.1 sodium/potassium/calcium exchanger 4 [Pieris rapae]